MVFIARQHTVCPSVRPSVRPPLRDTLVLYMTRRMATANKTCVSGKN